MNVASLRSTENQNTSAECKLAKIALMTISLWFMAWTPYGVINFSGIFETVTITPLFTIWGSLFAKANAVYNPIVYGIRYLWLFKCYSHKKFNLNLLFISHPKYRIALFKRFPWLSCSGDGHPDDGSSMASGVTTVDEKTATA